MFGTHNQKHKLLLTAVALGVLGIGGLLLATRAASQPTFGETAHLTVFSAAGQPTGKAMLSLPFLKDMEANSLLSVWVNGEQALRDFPIHPQAGWNNNVTFATPTDYSGNVVVQAGVSREPIPENWNKKQTKHKAFAEFSVPVETVDVGQMWDFSKVTKPEEAMTGPSTALAATTAPNQNATPDIGQRIAECAPTAAANSLISLMRKNNQGDKLPADPTALIDQLKADTKWTPGNGSLPDDFVAGKNMWAARMGVPIRTEKIGEQDGRGTIQELREVLDKGGAAEMRVRFTRPGGTKVIGGHLVTVVAVRTVNGQDFIDIHDPASPTGTDTYQVDGNQLMGYAVFEGDTYVSWGFSQIWEKTGAAMEPMTDAEMHGIQRDTGTEPKIKVIVVGSHYIPLASVHVGKGPECKDGDKEMPHYHTNAGVNTEDINGEKVTDPGGCGYGMVKDIPIIDVAVPR